MKKQHLYVMFAVLLLTLSSLGFIMKSPNTIEKGAPNKVKIVNNSKWDIDHIYISSIDSRRWGKDLLGDDILAPGEYFFVYADCDTYDVKIIDEDGIECIIEDVDICDGKETWYIGDLTDCD